MSEETTEINNRAILRAVERLTENVENLSERLNKFQREANAQFEAIREGIVYNNSKFDRLEAKIFETRSDVLNLRADVKDLAEETRKNNLLKKV